MRVVVEAPQVRPTWLRLVDRDEAERQARGQTWPERVERYAMLERKRW